MKTHIVERLNPKVSGAPGVAGVETNHSSVFPSTDSSLPDNHAQFDDEMDDVECRIDPNISGTNDMAPLHDPMAGGMNDWEENDDYREFLFRGKKPESALFTDDDDPDFDSNGGLPTPPPSYEGGYEPDREFNIGPVVRRRM